MKVTDIKTFAVDCFRTNWVFIKVYTDEGIDGVGEATLEYKEKATYRNGKSISRNILSDKTRLILKSIGIISIAMRTGVAAQF